MRQRFAVLGMLPALLPAVAFAAADADQKGMPQLDPSSYASQLFWLAVFFCLFYGFMALVAVPRLRGILTTRQQKIDGDLNFATDASHQAEALKQEWDRHLATAHEEARRLLAGIATDGRSKAASEEAALRASINQRLAVAEASIATARQAALGTVNEIAAGLVAEIMPKLGGLMIAKAEAEQAVGRQATVRPKAA